MKTIFRLALMAACLLLSACEWVKDSGVEGNGDVIMKTFDIGISNHYHFKLSVPANVTYMVADEPTMIVRLDENLIDYLTVSNDSHYPGTLHIRSTRPLRDFKVFDIILTTPCPSTFDCCGKVKLNVKGALDYKQAAIFLNVKDAAEVNVDELRAGGLQLVASGSAKVDIHSVDVMSRIELSVTGPVGMGLSRKAEPASVSLSGKTEQVELVLIGAGEVDLSNLDYKLLDRKVIGRGSVKTGDKPVYKNGQVQIPQKDNLSVNGLK